uniref:Velvet domain-containing protein n=1 Tax=Panagrellus redivivus TaxID=6233 RepID=A0A7E4VZA5_PANRE
MLGIQEGFYPTYRVASYPMPIPHLQVVQRVSQLHVVDLGPLNAPYNTVPILPTPGFYNHQAGVYNPVNYYPMQIPTGPTAMPLPAHYHSYFGTTPNNSHPIPIHRTPHDPYGSYDLSNRVMTFTPPAPTVAPRDSYYCMDYLGYDLDEPFINPPAQSSASTSTAISSAPIAIRSNSSATAHLVDYQRDVAPIENKENGSNDDSASIASISGIRMIGEHGMRGYKRRGSADELINEETESETGLHRRQLRHNVKGSF